MLPNWLYGKSKSKLASILGGGGGIPEDYDQVKAQVTQNTQDITALLDNLKVNGAVNLLNFNPATVTKEETTFTRNSDGTYTVMVNATTAASREVHTTITLPSGSYKLTGTPSNGSNICRMTVYSVTESRNLAVDEGSGSEFTITQTNQCGVYIDLRTGVPAGTYVFKPMISLPELELSYDDYVPYAKTNKELTENVADIAYESLTDYGSSEYTLTEGKMWQSKGVTFLYVAVNCTTVSSIESGSHIQIATIPSKFKKPQFNMYPTICNYRDGSTHIGAQLQVKTDGIIAIRGGEAGARYSGIIAF